MRDITTMCDSWQTLAGAILAMAKNDAAGGDLGALAWLVSDGADIADSLNPGGRAVVLRFCRRIMSRIEAGKVKRAWCVD